MVPHTIREKIKELESLGLSRNKIAKLIDISPAAISRFLSGERSGLSIAAKVLNFMAGTDKLGKFKVDGTTEEIVAIEKHSTKGQIKFYGTLPADEEILYEKVISETDTTLKSCQNIREIPNKLKQLSKELSEKHQNKIQIPYWIGAHLFQLYHVSNGAGSEKKQTDIPLHCSTRQQVLIILEGVREILKDLLIKTNPKEYTPWKEIDYKMQAVNLEGFIFLHKENPKDSSKSFLKGLQLGINWIGAQKSIPKALNYYIWRNLLDISLSNLNNALYSHSSKLIANSKNFFLILDRNFHKPKNIIGESVVEKVLSVINEHKENNLPANYNNIPFNYFLKEYSELKKYFLGKKEVLV